MPVSKLQIYQRSLERWLSEESTPPTPTGR